MRARPSSPRTQTCSASPTRSSSPSSRRATLPGQLRSPPVATRSESPAPAPPSFAPTVKVPDAEPPVARLTLRDRSGATGAMVAMPVVVLPYGRQDIDDDDIAAVVAALRAPMLTCGPLVERFEHAVGAAVGTAGELVRACSSGTAALHLAYAALGLGPCDEIITTPVTFSATAAAAYYVGATVRIADVDPGTGNIDPVSVARL